MVDPQTKKMLIGLTTHEGFLVTRYIDEGAHQIVYEASKANEKVVIKIPRSNLCYFIQVPPNKVFQTGGKRVISENITLESPKETEEYSKLLSKRLIALIGSPLISWIRPFDIAWNILTVELMHYSTKGKFSAILGDIQDYLRILNSQHTLNLLNDWSVLNSNESENDYITVYANEAPIYLNLPAFLSKDAERAKTTLASMRSKSSSSMSVDKNPFFPYISAMICGFDLPNDSQESILKMITSSVEAKEYLMQLGLLLGVLSKFIPYIRTLSLIPVDMLRIITLEDKMFLMGFLVEMASKTNLFDMEDVINCLQKI